MKLRKFLISHSILILSAMLILAGCNKNDDNVAEPGHDHDHHHATTLTISFLEENAQNPLTFTFKDPDGEGGNPPVVDAINLMPNRVYHSEVIVLDESNPDSPVDLTQVINEEADKHKFFFEISGLTMAHEYKDADKLNQPVGLVNQFTTGDAGSGTLKIRLKHYQNASDKANDTRGETDIEVVFNIVVN